MLNDADRELEVMKTKGEISSDWRDLEQVQRRGEVGGEQPRSFLVRPSQVMMGVRVWAWRGVEVVWSSKLGTGDRTVVLLSSDAARCTWACEVEKGLCCRSPAGLWRLGDSEASCHLMSGVRAEAGGSRGFV